MNFLPKFSRHAVSCEYDLPAVEAKVADGEVGSDKPLYIGSAVRGYPWQGKLDEIKEWNYALSEEEQRESAAALFLTLSKIH